MSKPASTGTNSRRKLRPTVTWRQPVKVTKKDHCCSLNWDKKRSATSADIRLDVVQRWFGLKQCKCGFDLVIRFSAPDPDLSTCVHLRTVSFIDFVIAMVRKLPLTCAAIWPLLFWRQTVNVTTKKPFWHCRLLVKVCLRKFIGCAQYSALIWPFRTFLKETPLFEIFGIINAPADWPWVVKLRVAKKILHLIHMHCKKILINVPRAGQS